VSHRPLVIVGGLTVGDYLLWNWSLNGNHDVLALVSGLTLTPLAVASLWLLALSLGRVIARHTRLPSHLPGRGRGRSEPHPTRLSSAGSGPPEEAQDSGQAAGRSGRIAA